MLTSLLRRLGFALGLIGIAAALGSSAEARQSSGISYLDNGTIRLGVDLYDGGKITYLSRSRSTADVIHDVQQSYSDGESHVSATGGELLDSRNDGSTIYTKVVPRTDEGTPCACVFETWVTLKGSTAQVRNRMTSSRTDEGERLPTSQELPALYTTSTAYRLFTYDGRALIRALRFAESATAPVASSFRVRRSRRPSTGPPSSGPAAAVSASSFRR